MRWIGMLFQTRIGGTLLEVQCGAPFSRCGKRRVLQCAVGARFLMHEKGKAYRCTTWHAFRIVKRVRYPMSGKGHASRGAESGTLPNAHGGHAFRGTERAHFSRLENRRASRDVKRCTLFDAYFLQCGMGTLSKAQEEARFPMQDGARLSERGNRHASRDGSWGRIPKTRK